MIQRHAHRALSKPFKLFDVDFYTATHPDEREQWHPVEVLADGNLTAVVLSFDLDLYPGCPTFSTSPLNSDLVAWDQTVRFLPIQLGVTKGQVLHLQSSTDHLHVQVGLPNVHGCTLGLGHHELLGKKDTRGGA